MKLNLKLAMIGVVAILGFAATRAHSQVVISGSSALYLEAGQASYAAQGCAWTTSSKIFTLTDHRSGSGGSVNVTDTGTAWITWTPSTPGNCSTIVANTEVVYVSTDSTVGNRCFFARPQCTLTTTATANQAGNNQLPGVGDSALPAAAITDISGQPTTVSATDIRPEDAAFATERALTGCGFPVAGSKYLGLGYTSGSQINGSTFQSAGGGSSFNVANFALTGNDPYTGTATPSSWTVTPVGATSAVVFVNPGNATGFGSLLAFNIDRAVLAGFLDGTYGRPQDLFPQGFSSTGTSGSVVYIREPLSGTFNTVEYAIPNSVEGLTSQEVGQASLSTITTGNLYPAFNCTNTTPSTTNTWLASQNPLNEKDSRGSNFSYRERAIGTGNEVKAVLATPDSLGYAFWSGANFSAATASTAKYLTVDGIDPIQETWSDGVVPTSGNGLLGNVTLSHVKDGTYPIWTLLRLVSLPGTPGATVASNLAKAALNFLSPHQPDFVPVDQLLVVRSHFSPPGVAYPGNAGTPANGSGSSAESGGDVGGLVLTLQSEGDYNLDNGVQTGSTGLRQ